MRWFLLILSIGCASEGTSLEGPIPCGGMTCDSGQICHSQESGSQCGVNPDAGIGPYQEYGWTCRELPADCDVTQDCYSGPFVYVSEDGRYVRTLCI